MSRQGDRDLSGVNQTSPCPLVCSVSLGREFDVKTGKNKQVLKINDILKVLKITLGWCVMKKWLVFFSLIVITLSLSAKIYFDTNVFKVNKVQFYSNKLPEGSEFTVLQISDLHNKVFGDNNEQLVNTVEKLNADIIVITGDLVDESTDNFKNVFSLMERITAINNNVFFVSGNHEWGNAYTVEFLNGLRERNVTILNNRNIKIMENNITLNLVGVDDVSRNHENSPQAFNSVYQDQYTILLSHSPGITEKYHDLRADLILSGHTHGGQVRIPYIGALVAPNQGFFPQLDKGTYQIGPNQYLYIDSGLGTSIAPIRFLNQSQLSLIKIKNRQGDRDLSV